MKEKLHLKYKRILPIRASHNNKRNLLLRQLAAAKYIEALRDGWDIINVDESVLRATDERKRGWVGVARRNYESSSQRLNGVNVIAAVSSSGRAFFTINQGRTNSLTIACFLSKLFDRVSSMRPDWKSRTLLLLDNASYHRSQYMRDFLKA